MSALPVHIMVVTGGTWAHFCRFLISYRKEFKSRPRRKTKNSFLLKFVNKNHRACKLENSAEGNWKREKQKIVLSELEIKKTVRLRNGGLQVCQELDRKLMCVGER